MSYPWLVTNRSIFLLLSATVICNPTNKISFLIHESLPDSNDRNTFTYHENLCLVPSEISYSYRVWSYRATKSWICLECSDPILRIQANAHDFNKDSILEGVVYVCCRRFDWMRRGSQKQRDQNRSKIDFLNSACHCTIIFKKQHHNRSRCDILH